MPTVSLVMPARDAATTIGAALSSALTQSRPFDEIIVVDDGSTDETAGIVAAHGGPIRLLAAGGAGVAAARNLGVRAAHTDLVTFLDADDLLLPGHLAALLAHDPGRGRLATANAYFLRASGLDPRDVRIKSFPRPSALRRAMLEENPVPIATIFPRRLIDDIGGFDEALAVAEDWDFWLRAVLADATVVADPVPRWIIRRMGTSTSTDLVRHADAVRTVLARTLDRADLTPSERAYVQRRLATRQPVELVTEGEEALLRGDFARARRALAEAAALCPSNRALVAKARLLRVGGPAAGRIFAARLRRHHASPVQDPAAARRARPPGERPCG